MVLTGAFAQAQTMDDALHAHWRGDHETALRIWREHAANGHMGAHMLVGGAYAKGEGVPQDFDEADRWFERYTEVFDPGRTLHIWKNPALIVGDFYDDTLWDTKYGAVSSKRAIRWYERAAAEGAALALLRLGDMHRLGRGTPKDAEEALSYYRRAAQAGEAEAYSRLGDLYLSGSLGAVDFARAREAFVEGIENVDFYSAERLGEMYAKGLGVEKDLPFARDLWETTAMMGNYTPANMSGLFLENRSTFDGWRVQALRWVLFTDRGKRPLSDEKNAERLARAEDIPPYTDEEIEAARQLTDAFLDANPHLRRPGAPPTTDEEIQAARRAADAFLDAHPRLRRIGAPPD